MKDPHKVHVLIALVDSSRIVTDTDTDDSSPVVRIRRVEVVQKQDLKEAERLLRRALEARTGQTMLDLELEDELSGIFKDLDLNSDEDETEPAQDDNDD